MPADGVGRDKKEDRLGMFEADGARLSYPLTVMGTSSDFFDYGVIGFS